MTAPKNHTLICKYRHCNIKFKPTHGRQTFCCPEHQVEERRLRQAEQYQGIKRGTYRRRVLTDAHNPADRKRSKKICHCCGVNPVMPGNYWLCAYCYRYGPGHDIEEYSAHVPRVSRSS